MIGVENAFYPLLVVMTLLSTFIFVVVDFDVIHPCFLFNITMTVSVLLATLTINTWNLYMSVDAALAVVSACIVFSFGCLYSEYQTRNIYLNNNTNDSYFFINTFDISSIKLIIISTILSILFYLQIIDVYNTSLLYGNTSGYSFEMIRIVRKANENDPLFSLGRWYNYRTLLAMSTAYICSFILILKIINKNNFLQVLKYVPPILIYIGFLIITGGRGGLFELVLFFLIISILLYQKKNFYSSKSKKKAFMFLVLGIFSFIVLFMIFGFITGKVSVGGRSPFLILAHYGGLSMPAFTMFLDNIQVENQYIGATTLKGIYNNLNALGFNLPKVPGFLSFVSFTGITTNVYTAMRRYIFDYGFIGMYLFMGLLGMFYTTFYNYIKGKSKNVPIIMLYGGIVLPLFLSTNDEIFLYSIFNTTLIYKLILFWLLYKVLVTVSVKR